MSVMCGKVGDFQHFKSILCAMHVSMCSKINVYASKSFQFKYFEVGEYTAQIQLLDKAGSRCCLCAPPLHDHGMSACTGSSSCVRIYIERRSLVIVSSNGRNVALDKS
eukprot:TRINITY_DN3632_c0_g1_i1.p1 TRINITY_DN3632_c0_g1~~TRINITY_DN3632_c0_g1_i1.p1  ORF type:complete len:108 (+),score=3.61 TRINITY_DN3632_c0_g1_i1:113-436(+)